MFPCKLPFTLVNIVHLFLRCKHQTYLMHWQSFSGILVRLYDRNIKEFSYENNFILWFVCVFFFCFSFTKETCIAICIGTQLIMSVDNTCRVSQFVEQEILFPIDCCFKSQKLLCVYLMSSFALQVALFKSNLMYIVKTK